MEEELPTHVKTGRSPEPSSPNGHAPAADEVRHIRQITLANEFVRKSIHLVSLTIPVAYYYLDRTTALWILGCVTVFSTVIDVGRHYWPGLRTVVNKIFGPILREHERDSKKKLLSGATWVLLSGFLCVLVFPKLITVTAFAILIISDASSALYGRTFGKRKFLDKSLEGSMAFIVSAWVVVLIAPKATHSPLEYAAASIGALVGAVVEAASVRLRLDDNLSVPVSIGLTMWGLLYLATIVDPAWARPIYDSIVSYR